MPVHPVRRKGRLVGYKWGRSGKLYTTRKYGKAGARKRAEKQATAIRKSGWKE